VKRLLFVVFLVVGAAACGGTTTSDPVSPATDSSPDQVRVADLSGFSFEVHQEPG
jgi:hypothetical protein